MVNLMYNPDTLITSKEEKMELSPSSVFYEDDYPYPWKPFKSNGGTGDTPADLLQPSTTAEPTPQPVVSKLCPFRKQISFVEDVRGGSRGCASTEANFMEEEFLPCLEEKCMLYRYSQTDGPYCGRI